MTKTIFLLQNFVLFKMSDESEHSKNEFYYPGELSDAQLLQSPTHSESTESQHSSQMKKFTTFSEANKQAGGEENNFSG